MDAESVAAVFAHWKVIMGHERARMDLKRAQVIRDRLRDGYSVDDLCLAVEGCAASAFHCGENDRGQRYDSLTLILRDADHVDKFISMGEQARRMIAAREQRREEAAAQEQKRAQPPTEEEKVRVRELLRSCKIRRVA
jgi:hypothetical protein